MVTIATNRAESAIRGRPALNWSGSVFDARQIYRLQGRIQSCEPDRTSLFRSWPAPDRIGILPQTRFANRLGTAVAAIFKPERAKTPRRNQPQGANRINASKFLAPNPFRRRCGRTFGSCQCRQHDSARRRNAHHGDRHRGGWHCPKFNPEQPAPKRPQQHDLKQAQSAGGEAFADNSRACGAPASTIRASNPDARSGAIPTAANEAAIKGT